MALLPQIPVVKMNDELTEEEQIDLFDSLFGQQYTCSMGLRKCVWVQIKPRTRFFVPCSCRHQTEVKETRTHFSHTFLPNGWKSVSLAVQNVLLKVRNTSAAFFVPCSRTQLKVVPLLCYIYWANLHSKTDIEMQGYV